jgi:hypothetical protein
LQIRMDPVINSKLEQQHRCIGLNKHLSAGISQNEECSSVFADTTPHSLGEVTEAKDMLHLP